MNSIFAKSRKKRRNELSQCVQQNLVKKLKNNFLPLKDKIRTFQSRCVSCVFSILHCQNWFWSSFVGVVILKWILTFCLKFPINAYISDIDKYMINRMSTAKFYWRQIENGLLCFAIDLLFVVFIFSHLSCFWNCFLAQSNKQNELLFQIYFLAQIFAT